ncbi:MAG TPA: uroporphyrinogen decarboxylase [Haliscomenobacter sp.]|nr:uroporphyrinogen decarboxylase [Haliscomenobacter sp.]
MMTDTAVALQNDLFLRVAKGETSDRPPIWLMRQAGRVLPQYRALRSKFPGFREFLFEPAAAAEATIQPIDELGVDAAIIFSDILVVPEAMGLHYDMVEKRGPLFPKTIQTAQDIAQLQSGEAAADNMEYVYEALRITKRELNGRVPLIGFAGAPWTIFAYMIEGQGSKTFSKAKQFLYREPVLSHLLLERITDTTIAYLKRKIANGADLIQLFDSWAGILSPEQYKTFATHYIGKICAAISEVPITVFSKGAWFALEDIAALNCQVIGLDWNITPAEARVRVGETPVLQGNLDPCFLYADHKTIRAGAVQMIEDFGQKHIVNLGRGLYPDIELDSVRVFVDTVKAYRY